MHSLNSDDGILANDGETSQFITFDRPRHADRLVGMLKRRYFTFARDIPAPQKEVDEHGVLNPAFLTRHKMRQWPMEYDFTRHPNQWLTARKSHNVHKGLLLLCSPERTFF